MLLLALSNYDICGGNLFPLTSKALQLLLTMSKYTVLGYSHQIHNATLLLQAGCFFQSLVCEHYDKTTTRF